MAFFQAMDFHEGEKLVHEKLRVTGRDNPTMPILSAQAAAMLQRAPLLAFGTLDAEDRPWTTLWGGDTGFSRPLGNNMVGIHTPVAASLDPVVEALVGSTPDGEVVREQGKGRLVSGLSIDLETRKRVKVAGRMVAGALGSRPSDEATEDNADTAKLDEKAEQALLQLVVHIDESLGNCPKYLNKRHITPASTAPKLISTSVPLDTKAIELINKSDLLFLSTSHSKYDMDTNHRGGPPGFVRCVPRSDGPTQFVYPEYSGNRLYQSLGNMMTNPRAGYCFPDFDTGDCLYVTGDTEILYGKEAAEVMPRSNLAVRVTITAARYVAGVLPLRGEAGEVSPYNPVVRYLAGEKATATTDSTTQSSVNTAKLLKQVSLTPTISRFTFSLTNAATYKAGQYVTLDLSDHLDIGYSHMRDDDPKSLNDDFVRTFTVSSPPGSPPRPTERLADDQFEITIRKVGVVTDFLFRHGLDARAGTELEVGVKGFGGSFSVKQDGSAPVVGFIAAGVGITPLMPSLSDLPTKSLKLLWTIRAADAGVAADLVKSHPEVVDGLTLFVTGTKSDSAEEKQAFEMLKDARTRIEYRRMTQADVESLLPKVKRWYVCTGTVQRAIVLQWLEGREVLYEDYNF